MKFGWPQGIMIALWGISLGLSISEEKPSKFLASLISIIIMAGLLYWGGFF